VSLGRGDLGRWLAPQDLIRRIVVTVDNLPRKTVPQRMSPVMPVEGAFAVYTQWYPRFQEAYRELGYPNGYVNDRLVEAIDTLLATPTSVGPLAVVHRARTAALTGADPAMTAALVIVDIQNDHFPGGTATQEILSSA